LGWVVDADWFGVVLGSLVTVEEIRGLDGKAGCNGLVGGWIGWLGW
jgi:hypothetical protein